MTLKSFPFGLPLLEAIRMDPLEAAATLQKERGNVAKLDILFNRIWYFFDPEDVRKILVDHHADFTRDPRQLKIFRSFNGRNVLSTEGPSWERQRRILSPGFTPKRIAGYTALMRSALDDCVSSELPTRAGDFADVDVDRLTTRITMDVILRTLFSEATTRAEADAISVAIRAISVQALRQFYWPVVPPDWLPYPGRREKLRHLATINALIGRHIASRTRTGGGTSEKDDVLSMMLSARDDSTATGSDGLSRQEVHDNCMVLFGAGFDTSSSGLTWWLGLMATHPEIAARVRQEVATAEDVTRLPLLNATLKETLRLYSPSVGLFGRIALKDVQIGSTLVPRGTMAVIPTWHLHHDSRSFPDPEVFRPERFLPGAPGIPRGAYMPFGAGPHFCLGQHFATVEMAVVAARLIRQFDVCSTQGASLPEAHIDLVLKPKTPLQVRFTAR
jgi:cytochrome P450